MDRPEVSRFWDYCAAPANQSFSKLNGKELVKLARPISLPGSASSRNFPAKERDPESNRCYAAFGGTLPQTARPISTLAITPTICIFHRSDRKASVAQERAATLRELYRIVKDGGYLMSSTPNNEDLSRQKNGSLPGMWSYFPRHTHNTCFAIWSRGLEDLMREIGFISRRTPYPSTVC